MSYIPFQSSDSIIVQESIVSPLWANQTYTLTSGSMYTSSAQATSGQGTSYLNVYNVPASQSNSVLQYSIAYGHISGSGSAPYNSFVPGSTPSRDIYGQYSSLIYGEAGGLDPFTFGGSNNTSRDILVLSVSRIQYKEALQPGSLNLSLTGPSGSISLTDNSNDVTIQSYIGSNEVFQIISGSNGTSWNGSDVQTASGSYGLFFPNISTIILNPRALSLPSGSGGIGLVMDETNSLSYSSSYSTNTSTLYSSIKNGNSFSLNSLETITSRYFNVKVNFTDFNYTTNPSIIDSKGNIIYTSLVNNPETFVTAIGLYNMQNELMAVAKLSTPLKKNFTQTLNLRVKIQS